MAIVARRHLCVKVVIALSMPLPPSPTGSNARCWKVESQPPSAVSCQLSTTRGLRLVHEANLNLFPTGTKVLVSFCANNGTLDCSAALAVGSVQRPGAPFAATKSAVDSRLSRPSVYQLIVVSFCYLLRFLYSLVQKVFKQRAVANHGFAEILSGSLPLTFRCSWGDADRWHPAARWVAARDG